MKLKHLTLATVVACSSIVSCSKSDESTETTDPITQNCTISTIKESEKDGNELFTSVYQYTYDSQNNTVKTAITSTEGNKDFVINTVGDSIKLVSEFGNYYIKNSAGRVIKSGQLKVTDHYSTYEYNSEGYLSKATSYYRGVIDGVSTFTWSNGNLTKSVYARATGDYTETEEFEYYTDKAALPNFDYLLTYFEYWEAFDHTEIPMVFNYGTGLFGKTSKNLLKTIKEDRNQISFTYNLDDKNDVKMEMRESRNNSLNSFELIYSCK